MGLDTNVLVRSLTRDDLEQFGLVKPFIQQNCTQSRPGFINRVVLCELIWVLESSYGYSKQLIVDVLERVRRTKQLRLESASLVWQALTLDQESHADFAACLISRANLPQGCTTTVTLDRKAAKTPGFGRLESLAKGFPTAQTAAALTDYRSCHAHCESNSQAPGIT